MNDLIKVSDLVIETLYQEGIDTFFGVTGGAVVHFFDSVSKKKETSAVFFNHEQSASFAVESFAKTRKSIGAGIFTTGPGATNALTGLAAAWLDSIPCVYISGQSRSTSTIGERNLRQVGTQEVNIVDMVKPITKYAVTVSNIYDIKYHLDKAIFLSQHERPGPVWLDIPVDFSWSDVSLNKLKKFNSEKEYPKDKDKTFPSSFREEFRALLDKSKRPLLLVGQGCRLSNSEDILKKLIFKSYVPFVTTWNMCDFMDFSEELNIGRAGISGQRGANMAVQNCDLLICLGTHLNNSITGTIFEAFAREAKTIVVDIDIDELANIPVKVDYKLNCDVKEFLEQFSEMDYVFKKNRDFWIEKCRNYSDLNDFSNKYSNIEIGINSLYLKKVISQSCEENTIFVTDGGGTNVYSSLQSCFNRKDQKLILSTGLCSMGSGIPEAIGAHFANPDRPIVCYIGDGSFPFNIQELQLVKNLSLPIKFFVLNNEGYTSIKTTQEDFLEGNFSGSTPESGIHLMDIKNTADCFGLHYYLLKDVSSLNKNLDQILSSRVPLICEVLLPIDEIIEPRQGFKEVQGEFKPQPLEDMYPFLNEDEFKELMIIDSWESI
jgi:acetolactate synthase-1/2/3 large subunit